MTIAKSYTFTNNVVADPAQVNQNFDDMIAAIGDTHHRDEDGSPIEPADIASGWGLIPSKGIIAFHDTVANIPTGYYFCNGANGTPDLRRKFILGVDADGGTSPLNTTGGEEDHTLIIAEMPAHTHIQNQHRHSRTGLSSGGSGGIRYDAGTGTTIYTDYATPTNQNEGGGGAHNNMPPYSAQVFIMKS